MKQLTILLLVCASLCACHTSQESLNPLTLNHTDTMYLNNVKYDSIYINNWQYQDRSNDTIYLEKVKQEYRYKYLHDTTYLHRVDTIPVIHTVTQTTRHIPTLYKWSLGLCILLLLFFLLLALKKLNPLTL